jgi:DNA-binding MarR family transcriptional regulator
MGGNGKAYDSGIDSVKAGALATVLRRGHEAANYFNVDISTRVRRGARHSHRSAMTALLPASGQVEGLRLLRTVVAGLHRSARAIESSTGVTNAQLFLLRQVASNEGLSVTELAARVGARPNAVSPVLGRLISAGLVRKSIAHADARRAELRLTPAGRRLLRRAPIPPTEELVAALSQLATQDLQALVQGLTALAAGLGLDPDAAPLLFESSGLASQAEQG